MDYTQMKRLEFQRKFWKVFGAEISIFEPTSQTLVGFIKMKAFKLKEDIRIYRDKSQQQELVRIHSRQIIDFGATYDIYDSATGQVLCSVHRRGFRSAFVRDHWDLYDANGQPFGAVQETSGSIALMRRWFAIVPYVGDIGELAFAFAPQTYNILYTASNPNAPSLVGTITHRKNPAVVKMDLDLTQGQVALDARINIALVALLSIVDAAKNS